MAESFSREKLRQAPQKDVEKSCVIFLLCHPGWCGASTNLTSRINGMTTHTTHTTHTPASAEVGSSIFTKVGFVFFLP